MPRVVHFEISANDPEKMIEFYKGVFGWEITKWDGPIPYWLVSTGDKSQPGIDGGFFVPHEQFIGTVNTVEVPNLDEYMEKVRSHHGQIVVEKMPIPGIGWLAYAKDIEGTIFGMMQADPSAGA